jgi:glycopeptide antibiotics resistance protein
MEIPAERIHFLEYGFLGFLLVKAFESENPNSNLKYILSLVSGAILGLSDELFQGVLQFQNIFPHIRRYFEWKDVFMNAFGTFLGVVFYFYVWEKGKKKNE